MTSSASSSTDRAFSAEQTRQILEDFRRDGYALIPGVFSADECARWRARTDALALRPECKAPAGDLEFVLRNPLEFDPAFAELFIREPILSLVRAVLGPLCRFCGQNVIRNQSGQAISNWHVDDCNQVDFPLPDEVPHWDLRAAMPVLWLTVQVAFSDILTINHGPSEVVPGSQFSGRICPKGPRPEFLGRGPTPILCRAGDAYLFNHQTWHRGSPNTSPDTRYLLQLQYAMGHHLAVRMSGLNVTPRVQAALEKASPEARAFLTAAAQYV